jgi:hypothetical protein
VRRRNRKSFRPTGAIASEMLYVLAMNIRPFARRALKLFPIVLLAAFAFTGTATAAAPNEIDGVWSFNGGSVVIQPEPNSEGKLLQGTVVIPTKFAASCEHPAEQVMWTKMEPQADGSFWGLHFWYEGDSATCKEDKLGRGPTAWRVLHESDGAPYLEVCFSHPGTSQPKIAPDGTATEDTFGCEKSSPLASLSEVEVPGGNGGSSGVSGVTFSKTVVLPSTTACVSRTSLKIALKDSKYDSLTEVVVKVNGKKVADVKGIKRLKNGITLKKLPSGTYKISVTATTVLKQRLSGSQTYKSCTKGTGKIKLKKVKHHHG